MLQLQIRNLLRITMLLFACFLSVGFLETPSHSMSVPYFSQMDSGWANDKMGSSGLTVRYYGCTMTCTAMVLSYYGENANPHSLNAWLSSHGGYDSQAELNWNVATTFPGNKVTPVQKQSWQGNASNCQLLNNELSAGHPVIVQIAGSASYYPWHWVVVTGRNGSNYQINDPVSQSITSLSTYKNTIYTVAVFRGNVSTPAPTPPAPTPSPAPTYGYCTNWASQCFNANAPAPGMNWTLFDASQWISLAEGKQWSTTKNPRLAVPGALIVWSGGDGGRGHVASVVSTNPTGIVVSEMNWALYKQGNCPKYHYKNETDDQFAYRQSNSMTDNWNNPTYASLTWSSILNRGSYSLAGLILPIQTTVPPPLNAPNSLGSGQNLNGGSYIGSANGLYALVMATNGNLVLYQRSATSALPLWATNTSTNGDPNTTAVLAALQPGGVLVLYTSSGHPVWASGSGGQGPATLVVQNDGNVVIYASQGVSWSSGTWH